MSLAPNLCILNNRLLNISYFKILSKYYVTWSFPCGTVVKNPPVNAGDTRNPGLIPTWGRSPGRVSGNPLQYSCLKNSMGIGASWGYSPWGHKELDMTEQASNNNVICTFFFVVIVYLFVSFYLATLWCIWNLSSQTRDRILALCIGSVES